MHIVLISTPIGFLGSGKGGGVELTLSSLVTGLLAKGHKVDVVAPKNSKLIDSCSKAKLHYVEGNEQKSTSILDFKNSHLKRPREVVEMYDFSSVIKDRID